LDALLVDKQLPALAGMVAFPLDMPVSAACRFLSADRPVIFAMVDKGKISSFKTGEEMAQMILNES